MWVACVRDQMFNRNLTLYVMRHEKNLVFVRLTHLARLTKNKVKENCLILFISVNFLSSQCISDD